MSEIAKGNERDVLINVKKVETECTHSSFYKFCLLPETQSNDTGTPIEYEQTNELIIGE